MASFEERMEKLEAVVERLERGELTLEESVKLFEEGMQLSQSCREELEAAEGRIEVLVNRGRGDMSAEKLELKYDDKDSDEINEGNNEDDD
jgi:exodeoxyribonuclease VII small subunit